jgi:phage anti-repressor protein
MNELIKINYDSERPTVSGRDLHTALEVQTRYNDWFNRMCEYGFAEGTDFYSILSKTPNGGRPSTDHQLTIPMAKELCMLQRTEKGKQFRTYFIQVEEKWNSPEEVMKRARQISGNGAADRYMRAQAMLMNAKSRVSKQMQKLWDRAGVKPEYQALAMQDYYDGLQLPREAFVGATTALYDATTIASKLGVMSKNGNPHAQAIGAIIGKLDIAPEEQAETPYSRNGHDGVSMQYTESVIGKITNWLEEHNYPCTIYGQGGKKYSVRHLVRK